MLTTVRILSDQGPTRVELARWHDQFVVVKRLQGFNPLMRQRLEREAQVVSRLQHDNIVPLLAVEEDALIYDYCPGVNLAEALEAGPLPVNRVVKVIRDVLSALDYAHGQGVIHFDVKPANIPHQGGALAADRFRLCQRPGPHRYHRTADHAGYPQLHGARTVRRRSHRS